MVRQEVKVFKVLQEEEPVLVVKDHKVDKDLLDPKDLQEEEPVRVVKAHREILELKVDKDSLVHKVVKEL
jgi:hypothetical protein